MGVPSVFLRTFGCNFRCKKFGRDRTEIIEGHNPEVIKIIAEVANHPEKYKTFKDLPIAFTGCDTYASIYPDFKQFVTKADTVVLAYDIVDLLPNRSWADEHLVITGGEPLLGWQRAFQDLLSHDTMQSLKELTFETNGTQSLTSDFKAFLKSWTDKRGYDKLTFSVSPKLSGSGEDTKESIRPEIIAEYQSLGHTYLKLVVATEQDVDEALGVIAKYRDTGFQGDVYLMPVGGVEAVYSLNNRRVAELALQHGLRYSDRLQVPLFKNAWGT
jgi:7-carboxy-7-deazaguanine synthase